MKMLVTAGPTREYLDSVRFISNASSGRMGYAIAAAAAARGHEVVLISGPTALDPPTVDVVQVTTADQMLAAAQAAFEGCHAAVMTAAVTDYRPLVQLAQKAPKVMGTWAIELTSTPDICATLGAVKGDRVVVGFAVQDEDPHRRAEAKLERKHCDAIVLNSPQTLGSPSIRFEIKVAGASWSPPRSANKGEAAECIVDVVERLVEARRPADQ